MPVPNLPQESAVHGTGATSSLVDPTAPYLQEGRRFLRLAALCQASATLEVLIRSLSGDESVERNAVERLLNVAKLSIEAERMSASEHYFDEDLARIHPTRSPFLQDRIS